MFEELNKKALAARMSSSAVKDAIYRGCCDPGVPEDKCELEPENVCQGYPCGKQECEGCDEVPEDRQTEYIKEEETEVSPDSDSDV